MKKQKTTERETRSLHDIDYRELKEIAKRAKAGDETAKEEARIIGEAIKKSKIFDNLSDITKDIVQGYIAAFNRIHKTNFKTIDQVEKYLRDNNLSPEEDVNFEELVETMVVRPKDYVRTLGVLTDRVFDNKITLKKGQKGKQKVLLRKENKKKKIKEVSIFASVNYDKVLQDLGENAKIPEFTDDGRQVLDGILSNYLAGNRIMTYLMIYKGFTGDENCERLPDGVFEMISEALLSFRGWLRIENNGSNQRTDKNYGEPILIFRQYEETESVIINGKEVNGGKGIIEVYELSVLCRFALDNGNEVDTRPIKLLNVPKINNTPENLKLKRYLYNRVIIMRNDYERNVLKDHKNMKVNRKISLESVFKYIRADNIDKTNSGRQKKAKVVKKIFTILDYWRDFGLIEGYVKTTRPGSTETDGIEINFFKKLEKKNP